MRVLLILTGRGGELDRQTVTYNNEDDSAEVSEHIHDAMRAWVLSPGDTIHIEELDL